MRMKRFLCADSNEYVEGRDSEAHSKANTRTYSLLAHPILRDQVQSFARWTALVAHPYDFASGGASTSPPMTMSQLLTKQKDSPVDRGRKLIEGALFVLDLSIAQQAMLYGDLTAKFIFDALWHEEGRRFRSKAEIDSNDVSQTSAWELLNNPNNPWLKEAVAMLVLDSRFLQCKKRSIEVDHCKGRQMLYQMVMKQFMPIVKQPTVKGEEDVRKSGGAQYVEVDPTPMQIMAGSVWMRRIFNLAEDVKFEVRRNAGGKRIVVMNMAGAEVFLPDVVSWSEGRFHYPMGLIDRIRERDLMVDNYLDYTILTQIGADSRQRLVRAIAAPNYSSLTQ